MKAAQAVAPARERGLKSGLRELPTNSGGRSREGAWIEIGVSNWYDPAPRGRSREGAWIEIRTNSRDTVLSAVAPARERGLKCGCCERIGQHNFVAPARERGLKSNPKRGDIIVYDSRSREGAWIEMV